MALFESLPIGQLSAGALVALIVLLILKGYLVPRQQLLDTQADRDKWRDAADKQLAAILQLGATNEKLLAGVEMMNHAVADLQRMAQQQEREP